MLSVGSLAGAETGRDPRAGDGDGRKSGGPFGLWGVAPRTVGLAHDAVAGRSSGTSMDQRYVALLVEFAKVSLAA